MSRNWRFLPGPQWRFQPGPNTQLTAERQALRNALKRAERVEGEPAKRACAEKIKQVSYSLRKVRKEVKLCVEVEASSAQVSEKLRQTRGEQRRETLQRNISISDRTVNSLP